MGFQCSNNMHEMSHASFWGDYAKLRSLKFARLVSSARFCAQLRQCALQLVQHFLQFPELARAIAAGDGGVDRFRRRRDGLDQPHPLRGNRHQAAALIGLGVFMAAAGVSCSQRLGDIAASLPALGEQEMVTLLGGSP